MKMKKSMQNAARQFPILADGVLYFVGNDLWEMKGTGKLMCRAQPVMRRKTPACRHKRRSAAEEIPAAATAAPAADIAH